MRCLPLILCLPALMGAQDAREILRKALADDAKNAAASRNYTFVEHLTVRTFDGSGKPTVRQQEDNDMTLLEGSPYRRAISRNGKPLSAKDERKEQERLTKSIEDRRKETAEQRQRRIDAWKRKEEKDREPLQEVPDGFVLTFAPDQVLDGHEVFVIDATPKPGYQPRSKEGAYLSKVKIRFFITKQADQCMKLEFETLDTIAWRGIVARVGKGARLTIELTHVNDEVWLIKRIHLTGNARVMLVKSFKGEVDLTYSDYRKFSAESRIVTIGQ